MDGLRRFGSLCAGVVVLVVCWLVAFATVAGWMLLDAGGALLASLGVPVVVVLLAVGGLLGVAFEEGRGPQTSGEGPTTKALVVFFFAGCGALVVASGVLNFSGAQIYHARFGERTEAVLSSVMEFNGESGAVVKRWYYVRDSVSRADLGPLAIPPPDGTEEGDPITVLVDPAGWIRPVPADSAGWTTVPTRILLGCAGAVALGALGVLATGLVAPATRRPR